jgi:hypothetical protein
MWSEFDGNNCRFFCTIAEDQQTNHRKHKSLF